MFKIGNGYDVHKLVEGRRLILCGVEIPHIVGLLGHSDADVAAHALSDALLGSVALGDIGKIFPDNDPAYKDADSMKLLAHVAALVRECGYMPVNADITIMAERPKLAPYIVQMRENIAAACGVGVDAVSVKATTTEGLGFVGREEGIAASAVVLVTSI